MEQNYFSHTGNYGYASTDGEHRITQEHTGRTKQSLPDVGDDNVLSFTTIFPSESTASQTMPPFKGEEGFFKQSINWCVKKPCISHSWNIALDLLNLLYHLTPCVSGLICGMCSATITFILINNIHVSQFAFYLFPGYFYFLQKALHLNTTFSRSATFGYMNFFETMAIIYAAVEIERMTNWIYLPTSLTVFACFYPVLTMVKYSHDFIVQVTPAPRLVGIEPNPGPSSDSELPEQWLCIYSSDAISIYYGKNYVDDEPCFIISCTAPYYQFVGHAPFRSPRTVHWLQLFVALTAIRGANQHDTAGAIASLFPRINLDICDLVFRYDVLLEHPNIRSNLDLAYVTIEDSLIIDIIRQVTTYMNFHDLGFSNILDALCTPGGRLEVDAHNSYHLEGILNEPESRNESEVNDVVDDHESDTDSISSNTSQTLCLNTECYDIEADDDFIPFSQSQYSRNFQSFAARYNPGDVPHATYAFSVKFGYKDTRYHFGEFLYRRNHPSERIVMRYHKQRFAYFNDPFPCDSSGKVNNLKNYSLVPLPYIDFKYTQVTRLPHMRVSDDNQIVLPLANTFEAARFLEDGLVPVYQSLRKDLDDWLAMFPKGDVGPVARDWLDVPTYGDDRACVLSARVHLLDHTFVIPFLPFLDIGHPDDIVGCLIEILGGMPSLCRLDLLMEDTREYSPRTPITHFVGITRFSNDMKGYKKLLVGIETNPGPQNDLLKYLKNMDSLPLIDSTRRSRSNFHRNSHKRVMKQSEKALLKSRRKTDNVKTGFVGEGLFDVGIDEESRNFIGEAIGQIREVFSQGANLKVDLGLQGALADIISGAKRVGGLIYDFVIFLIRSFIDMIPEHVSDIVVSVLTLLVGDIFSLEGDGEQEYEYVGEGLISSSMYAAYSSFLSQYIPEGDMLAIWKTGIKYKNLAKDSAPMFAWFFSMLKKIIFYLNEHFPTLIHLPGCLFSSDITFYFKSLQVIRDGTRDGSVPPHQLAMMVFALQDKIEMDFKENPKSVDSASYSYLLSTIGSLAKFYESHVAPRSGCRNEPLGIMTTGPTNVGKSTFGMPLLLAILARTKEGQPLKDFLDDHFGTVFFRIAMNEFWDGMLPLTHKVIVYDDFGQLTDSVGTPNLDALEWIRLKNTAPFHLHYSGIENKMKHYANPDILFGSTNRPFMKFDSIVSNEALIRRFDIAVCQLPKAKYCVKGTVTSNPWTRRMDMAKIRADFPLDPLDASTYAESSVLEYIEWDFTHGRPKIDGFIYSFDELVEHGAKMLKAFQERGKHMLNYHDHIKQKFGNISLAQRKVDDVVVVPPTGDPQSESYLRILNSMIGKIGEEQNAFDNAYKIALDHWKPISSTLIMICGATSLYSAFSSWKLESPGRGKPTKKGGKKSYNGGKVKYVVQDPNAPMPCDHFDMEGAEPGQKADYLFKIARRNQYFLTINGEIKPLCQAVFICERIFVLPRHSFECLTDLYIKQCKDAKNDVQFTIELHGIISMQKEISFEIGDIAASWGHFQKDFVLVKLHRETCRLHSNIVGAFLKREESNSEQNYYSHIIYHRNELSSHIVCPVTVSYSTCRYNAEGDWSARLNYNAPSMVSDCGAPLVCQDPRFARPVILGFHVAGRNGALTKSCLAMELFQEDFDYPLKYLRGNLEFVEKFPVMEPAPYELEGFSTYGELPTLYLPSKTCLEPTPFFGKITEVKTYPAPLTKFTKNGVTVDPASLARDKYSHPEVSINREALLRAVATVSKMILPAYDNAPWEPKVLTFEEAICGIPGVDFVDAINRSTSPGYPFVLNRKLPGKKDWLGTAEPTDINCHPVQQLKGEIMEVIECMARSERLFFPFVDHLKDERRTKEKCDAGKTRQFMVGNMHLTIVIKMYFGDYIRHICSNRIRNGIAIGMDPYTEWDMLYEHMTSLQDALLTAGDYSAYDAKIPVPISMGAMNIADMYYFNSSEKDSRIREMVSQEIVNSCHINRGIVYFYNGGNPSGQGMTTVHNSVVGLILLVYIAFVSSDVTEDTLLANCTLIVFGDDNMIQYRKILEGVFEQSNLEALMKLYLNLAYTVETKDDSKVSGRTIWEVSFLKRGFLKVRGVITSPIDLSVILETLNWQKKNSTRAQMLERIDGFFCELAQHGKIVFEQWSPLLNKLSVQFYEYSSLYADYLMAFNGHINYDFF